MILCQQCDKSITSAAIIEYTLDSDYVDETIAIHQECKKAYEAKKDGLNIPCPKCKTTGKFNLLKTPAIPINTNNNLCDTSSEAARQIILAAEKAPCNLCDGHGYLAKEPIPVVIDWKKA